MKWNDYNPGDPAQYVPMRNWGRDHWSTLLYIETRAVDHRGVLDNQHMRTNARLHRELLGKAQFRDGMHGEHPTRLADGSLLERHDDWSCIEDFAAHGLLLAQFRPTPRSQHMAGAPFANTEARIIMLSKGVALVHAIRQHKRDGGHTSNFFYRPTSWDRLRDLYWRLTHERERERALRLATS